MKRKKKEGGIHKMHQIRVRRDRSAKLSTQNENAPKREKGVSAVVHPSINANRVFLVLG